jgi:hypothetical protein
VHALGKLIDGQAGILLQGAEERPVDIVDHQNHHFMV